jgi:hypothetical protein
MPVISHKLEGSRETVPLRRADLTRGRGGPRCWPGSAYCSRGEAPLSSPGSTLSTLFRNVTSTGGKKKGSLKGKKTGIVGWGTPWRTFTLTQTHEKLYQSKEYTTNIDDKADLCIIGKAACSWVQWQLSTLVLLLSTLAAATFIFSGKGGCSLVYWRNMWSYSGMGLKEILFLFDIFKVV